LFALLALALFSGVQGSTIQAGQDIQSAIDSAKAGDIILVGPGDHDAFVVNRPLTILGQGEPILHAAIQKPAIKVSCEGVTVSGFKIIGVGKDTTAKFNYYMENRAAASGQSLDQPNAAITVSASDFRLEDTIIFGSQVGLMAKNQDNLTVANVTLESCDSGLVLTQCDSSRLENCSFSNCRKYGLDAEGCRNILFKRNRVVGTSSAGALFKQSEGCLIEDNVFSENTFGLSLWRTTESRVLRNRADHNYYGFLITDSSDNNTISENSALDNSRDEIITGFGIGISLEENSSHNIVSRNVARGNFNGLEVSRGCKYNAIFGNEASDNRHGIRLNENRNNLIFGNNFGSNMINAYENASLNIWNTTLGNYYDDYSGRDADGDGIGDSPYRLPGQDSGSMDYRPLMKLHHNVTWNESSVRDEVKLYAVYGLAYEEIPAYSNKGGTIVISSPVRTSPPKWSNSEPLDVSRANY